MHRIGHVDILIYRSKIRLKMQKKAFKYNTRRRGGRYECRRARRQILTPFGISPSLPLRVGYALHFSAVSGRLHDWSNEIAFQSSCKADLRVSKEGDNYDDGKMSRNGPLVGHHIVRSWGTHCPRRGFGESNDCGGPRNNRGRGDQCGKGADQRGDRDRRSRQRRYSLYGVD
jgi:hypothetical protein